MQTDYLNRATACVAQTPGIQFERLVVRVGLYDAPVAQQQAFLLELETAGFVLRRSPKTSHESSGDWIYVYPVGHQFKPLFQPSRSGVQGCKVMRPGDPDYPSDLEQPPTPAILRRHLDPEKIAALEAEERAERRKPKLKLRVNPNPRPPKPQRTGQVGRPRAATTDSSGLARFLAALKTAEAEAIANQQRLPSATQILAAAGLSAGYLHTHRPSAEQGKEVYRAAQQRVLSSIVEAQEPIEPPDWLVNRLRAFEQAIAQAEALAIANDIPMPTLKSVCLKIGVRTNWLSPSNEQAAPVRLAYDAAKTRVLARRKAQRPTLKGSGLERFLAALEAAENRAIATGERLAPAAHIEQAAGLSKGYIHSGKANASIAKDAYWQARQRTLEALQQEGLPTSSSEAIVQRLSALIQQAEAEAAEWGMPTLTTLCQKAGVRTNWLVPSNPRATAIRQQYEAACQRIDAATNRRTIGSDVAELKAEVETLRQENEAAIRENAKLKQLLKQVLKSDLRSVS